MLNQEPYCGMKIKGIGDYYYENIYVYITVPICLVGMILNLLNVLVFTRKTMNSPPNLILAHLAFVDSLFLLSNIARFWIISIQPKSGFDQKQPNSLRLDNLFSIITVSTLQFISAFLTVQLAAWRYIAVVHPLKERHLCTKKMTRNVVIIGYVICCVLYTIPYYLSHDIETSSEKGKTTYIATTMRHPIMNSIRKFVYGIVTKVLTSLVLTGLTSRIVVTLLARKTHREQLSPSASNQNDMKNVEMRQQTKRSTAILLAVAALFLVAEFPRGILWLMRTINKQGWRTSYRSLVPIFNTITNINTSITFMVYYTLSQQFRTTFKSLFNSNKCTISHQRRTPLALGGTGKPESRRKTSEV